MTAGRMMIGLLSAALVGGCATVPREAGFPDVERAVAERTGGKRVHWNQGTASDAAVAESVNAMLAQELTADEAVQIALLNNRDLQATFENLMIAQADLVAAGLLRNPVFDAEVSFVEGGSGTGLELALVQDFIDILYIPLRKRLAAAAFEATKLRVAGEVLDLAGEVRAAFYSLQAALQTLEMRRQVAAATGASYELAQRLRAAGNNRELDLANERALHEQSKLDVRAAEAQVAQARERLNRLMGLWGTRTNWTVAPRLPAVPSDPVGGNAKPICLVAGDRVAVLEHPGPAGAAAEIGPAGDLGGYLVFAAAVGNRHLIARPVDRGPKRHCGGSAVRAEAAARGALGFAIVDGPRVHRGQRRCAGRN